MCALSGMQSALWYHIFGYTSAPFLWLLVMVYWTLHRSLVEGIVMTYFSTFMLVTMSGVPLDLGFANLLAVYGTIYLLRDRILWSGVNSFMLACGIAALVLPIFTFGLSFIFEERPIHTFHFFDWLIRSLLTAASAMPFYFIFTWVDRFTMRAVPNENESGVI